MKTTLVHWQQQMLDAYQRLGRAYAVRRDRNGSPRVSLDGRPETNMHAALKRVEKALAAAPRAQWEG